VAVRLALCPGMRYLGRGNGSWQSFHSWLSIVFGASLNGEKVRQENIEGRVVVCGHVEALTSRIPGWFGAFTGNDVVGRDWWQLDIGEEANVGPTCH